MERPQASSLLNSVRLSSTGAPARHSAPMVESGDTSTRWPPMFMDEAMARALAPGRAAASPGTMGRNAGSTTPEVLLYTETTAVSSETTNVTVLGVDTLATSDTS